MTKVSSYMIILVIFVALAIFIYNLPDYVHYNLRITFAIILFFSMAKLMEYAGKIAS